MELTEDQIIKNMVLLANIVIETNRCHMNMNGLVFHVDKT